MANSCFTLVIENGFRISRDYFSKEMLLMAIKTLFGVEKANNVDDWIGTAITDGTYRDDGFYVHYIRI